MPYDMPPNPGFIRRSSFGLLTNSQTFTSPLTRATQRALLGGARWQATYTLRRMHAREAGPWVAFFLRCDGMVSTFNAYDPDRKAPQGNAIGTPLVKGAGQTGSTLLIDGCTPGIMGWLRAGDYFSVSGELKQVTQDANTNGSGETTLNFKPALRKSPADNAPIIVDKPTCTMILSDDSQAIWEGDERSVYEEKAFSAYEVF